MSTAYAILQISKALSKNNYKNDTILDTRGEEVNVPVKNLPSWDFADMERSNTQMTKKAADHPRSKQSMMTQGFSITVVTCASKEMLPLFLG